VIAITSEFGRFEEFFSDYIFPAWPIWTALAIAAIGGALYFSYRKGWHSLAWKHRLLSGTVAVVILAAGIPTGYYLASPLFERSLACEASPLAGSGAGSDECEEQVVAGDETPAATQRHRCPGRDRRTDPAAPFRRGPAGRVPRRGRLSFRNGKRC
jgi:hypothetical protein